MMAEAIGRSAKTLEALYAHPIPANLHWTDVLTLIRRFGSIEHQRHGHLHVGIAGHGLTLKHTNAKQVDKDQIIQLRDFLKGLGITPGHPSAATPDADTAAEPGLIVVLGDYDAKLWHRPAAHAHPEGGHLLYPHDPHHLRGHAHHAKQTGFEGEPPPEDYDFYKALVKALASAPKILVIGDAAHKDSPMQLFRQYLTKHHRGLLQRIEAFADADVAALSEVKIGAIAGRYWH